MTKEMKNLIDSADTIIKHKGDCSRVHDCRHCCLRNGGCSSSYTICLKRALKFRKEHVDDEI